MKKTKKPMKINQIEKVVIQSFFHKCFVTILSHENVSNIFKLNGIVIPLIAVVSEANLSLDHIKITYDDLKDIKVDAIKAIFIIEKRLENKFYKDMLIDNKPIIEHFLDMFDLFIRTDLPKIMENVLNVFKEADMKAQVEHVKNKVTVH